MCMFCQLGVRSRDLCEVKGGKGRCPSRPKLGGGITGPRRTTHIRGRPVGEALSVLPRLGKGGQVADNSQVGDALGVRW